ncbi:patatin-like phospholipase family protein [Natronospora cellulosivora (SeqCode)]
MKFRKFASEHANIRTSLVLSGGGAKGAYQVGAIKSFLENDICFDLIVGSSIGAMNGALLAEFILQGMNNKEIYQRLRGFWLGLNNILTFNWWGFIKNILTPVRIPSIYTNVVLRKILNQYIPDCRSFSDYTKCQLSLTGTNLNKKKLKYFDFNSTAPVIDALLASMSYPVAFPAVKINNDFYIDGGALSNAPLKEAILWGSKDVYVVFLQPLSIIEGEISEGDKEYLSAIELIEEFIELASNQLMYGDLEDVKKINGLINLINKYQYSLPKSFLKEIRELFDLRFKDKKKYIRIHEIAPDKVLDPPGLKGFCDAKGIEGIMKKGEEDTMNFFAKKV